MTRTFLYKSIEIQTSASTCGVTVYQLKLTCLKSTIETLEKRCAICSKLTIKSPERRQQTTTIHILPKISQSKGN